MSGALAANKCQWRTSSKYINWCHSVCSTRRSTVVTVAPSSHSVCFSVLGRDVLAMCLRHISKLFYRRCYTITTHNSNICNCFICHKIQQNIFAFDRYLANSLKTHIQHCHLAGKHVHTYNEFMDITNSLTTHKVVRYKRAAL